MGERHIHLEAAQLVRRYPAPPIFVGFRGKGRLQLNWTGIVGRRRRHLHRRQPFHVCHHQERDASARQAAFRPYDRTFLRPLKGTFLADLIACVSLFVVLAFSDNGSSTRSLVIVFRFLQSFACFG
jgi:hypothetical protein